MINVIANIIGSISGYKFDPDTIRFINVSNITKGRYALDWLIIQLKSTGLWDSDKIIALYPTIGDTAENFKYNLINPLDTDDAYRREFSSADMVFLPNHIGYYNENANCYTNTNIIPSSHLLLNDVHVFVELLKETTDGVVFGSVGSVGVNSRFWYWPKFSGTNCQLNIHSNLAISVSGHTSTIHRTLLQRESSTIIRVYDDGIKFAERLTSTSSTRSDVSIYEGGSNNNGTFGNAYLGRLGVTSYGKSLSPSEITIYDSIISSFRTRLYNESVYDVYIFLGDSQTAGRVLASDFSSDYLGKQNGYLVNLTLPNLISVGQTTSITDTGEANTDYRGFEQEFCRQHIIRKNKVIVFKQGRGSSYLAQQTGTKWTWGLEGIQDTYDQWYKFTTKWDVFVTYMASIGVKYNIKGVFIHLGNNDAMVEADSNNFGTNLSNFIDAIRTKVGVSNLKCVLAKIYGGADSVEDYWETVSNAIVNVAGTKDNCSYFECSDLPRKDTVHYTLDGLITGGQRVYNLF